MTKKKVTLSIDSKIYDTFRKYCEENAIMLSKKIEIIMRSTLKNKNKYAVCMFLMIIFSIFFANALQFYDATQGDFNNGTYTNTTYNGSAVILVNGNLTGTFTSRIFDANSLSRWTNLSWNGFLPKKEYLLAVDAQGKVYSSSNSGATWILKNSSYGRTGDTQDMFSDASANLYIIANSNKEVWKSSNSGVSWIKVNNTFASNDLFAGAGDSLNNLYVIAGQSQGIVFRSSNNGTTWTQVNDSYNGGNGAARGMTINKSNVVFAVDAQGKVYSSSNSGATWILKNSSYGRTGDTQDMFSDASANLYIIANSNKEVWKSSNSGVSWIKVNNTFASNDLFAGAGDSLNNLYVIAGQSQGIVFRSSNNGTTWTQVNDSYNGGNGAARGMTALLLRTNISFQVRNCSSLCTNEEFVGENGTSNSYFYNLSNNINLTGRYFQYKIYFSTQEADLTASLFNVSINYALLDTIPPTINIISPENKTYTSSIVFLNYTASDDNAIDKCWYVLDESPAATLLGCSTASIVGLSEGSHALQIYANDSAGNVNFSSISFSIDSTPPSWSNIQSGNPAVYSENVLSSFNVSWSDSNSVSRVWFESNFSGSDRNYSMYLIASNKYGFNTSIGAGTFYWISYANDSFGNLNSSSTQIINVTKTGSAVDIYINGNKNQNLSIAYGTQINVTIIGFNGSASLYKNGELIAGGNEINVLGAGIYNYTAIILESENVSGSSRTLFLNVTRASPTLNLVIDGSPANKTTTYGTGTNTTGFNGNIGGGDLTYNLFRNNLSLGSGETVSDIGVLGVGIYVYVFNTSGGQNYSAASVSRNLTINKAIPQLNLYINGNEGNQSQVYGNTSNITAIISDSNLIIELKKNGIVVANNSDLLSEILILAVGLYNYSAVFSGNQNYSAVNKTFLLNITKATPELNLLINGFDSDISVSAGANFNVNASSLSPLGALVQLYENSALVGNSSSIFIVKNYSTLGNRVWRVSILTSQNYSTVNKTHTITVVDQNSPQFSNLSAIPTSPTIYSPTKVYQFNATWTDNIGISEVIFQISNVNYSYNKGNISKNGNEYYINFTKLAVTSYSYRWWANDSSGNLVSSPLQNYTVDRAVAALFFTITPSWTVNYGTTTTVSCSANNVESATVLTRNNTFVANPDTGILASSSYNYACTSAQTQNYTSASVTGTLTVNKANPVINLTLNDIAADVTLPSSGGEVAINATLNSPSNGEINLTINGESINYSLTPLYISKLFSTVGNHTVTAYFAGDENYTDGSQSRAIIVSPQSSGGGGGGGGGGGSSESSGGGGSGIIINKKVSEEKNIEFSKLDDVLIYPGEVKILELSVKNTGKTFLNKCKLIGIGEYLNWIESDDLKNINIGEIADYLFRLQAPINATTNYSVQLRLECLEKNADLSFEAIVIPHGFFINIKEMTLLTKNELTVNFSITGKTDSRERILFMVTNEDGEVISEKEDSYDIDLEEKNFSVILDVSKARNELLKVAAKKAGADINFVEEFFVYDSSQFVTGFALLDNINRPLLYIVSTIIIFGVIAFFIIKRILRFRKWRGY
ncbi:MAG: hypothetical protein AABW75_01010 [Nanoarchaeota archaeon]